MSPASCGKVVLIFIISSAKLLVSIPPTLSFYGEPLFLSILFFLRRASLFVHIFLFTEILSFCPYFSFTGRLSLRPYFFFCNISNLATVSFYPCTYKNSDKFAMCWHCCRWCALLFVGYFLVIIESFLLLL